MLTCSRVTPPTALWQSHTPKPADPAEPHQTKAYTDPTVPLAPALISKLNHFVAVVLAR